MQASRYTKNEREWALKLARQAIIDHPEKPSPEDTPECFEEKKGVFVTLSLHERLRGSMGYLTPDFTIKEGIIDCAQLAAYEDPRFQALEKDMIEETEIEISVLELPKRLEYTGTDELLSQLSRDQGVIISLGERRATYLPQVWDSIPDKKEFLANLCLKAGLPPSTWRQPGLEVMTYTVEKIDNRETAR